MRGHYNQSDMELGRVFPKCGRGHEEPTCCGSTLTDSHAGVILRVGGRDSQLSPGEYQQIQLAPWVTAAA